MARVVIQVDGRNLPGLRCSPGPNAGPYENVHVGIGRRGAATQLFRGDSPSTTWRFDVRVVVAPDGSTDFRGQLVDGKRGDRFIYLNWGTVAENASFQLFRRAKVMLSDIDPVLLQKAVESDVELHCTVDLTDATGNPTCARFVPPAISWSVGHSAAPAGVIP